MTIETNQKHPYIPHLKEGALRASLVNSLPVSHGTSTTEVKIQSSPKNSAIPKDFSNALRGQIGLLREENGQIELSEQLQIMTKSPTINTLHDIGDLLKQKGGEEELAAWLDEHLPLSYQENAASDLNKDVAQEATLLTVTDALKSLTSDELATAQNMGAAMAVNGPSLARPLPEEAKLNMLGEDVAQEATLLTLTDALKSLTPDELATAQNMSAAMALNGPSLATPLPDEAQLNMLGEEDVISGDFLQKETVLRQSIQNGQGFNLQAMENTDPAEKTALLEKQTSISGIEKMAPGVTADMLTPHRLIDSRTDSPAITRPLTHPGWSKDLGEQIIWMNNKAISAAEIKLNPEHLGPISIRIDVNKDQATIMFTAQHVEVKEMLEASIPKLREMLATQQLNLVNVNISQNSTSDQGRSQSQAFSKTPENSEQGIDGVTNTLEKIEHDGAVVGKGLLSLYA